MAAADSGASFAILAEDLVEVLSGVRRAVRRAAPPVFGPLTGSQVELLRLIRTEPGTSVADVATRLRLAPNTVSTLVGQLVDAGMQVRDVDDRDRRVARLRMTRQAAERLEEWRALRLVAVTEALAGLDPDERARLHAALGVLARLAQTLEQERASQETA